jgi:hypothetical protein
MFSPIISTFLSYVIEKNPIREVVPFWHCRRENREVWKLAFKSWCVRFNRLSFSKGLCSVENAVARLSKAQELHWMYSMGSALTKGWQCRSQCEHHWCQSTTFLGRKHLPSLFQRPLKWALSILTHCIESGNPHLGVVLKTVESDLCGTLVFIS